MNIDKALAELRREFSTLLWSTKNGVIFGHTAICHIVVDCGVSGEKMWRCYMPGEITRGEGYTPVSAVRAWLAAQPTAAFYPAPPSGEAVKLRGVLATQGESWSLAGWSGASPSDMREVAWDGMNTAPQDEKFPVLYYPVVIRVPVPVEPPVLVGEVSDV